MNDQELRRRLSAGQGTVTISQSTLDSTAVGQLLATCYGDQPITISGAKQDEAATGVSLTGQSTLLGQDCPVSASFSVDDSGEVHALLRYQLRDASPGPLAWTFSRSFPALPAVPDYSNPIPARVNGRTVGLRAQRSFLDALDLFDSWFVVSTHDGTDPVSGLAVSAGINFVSKLRPKGMLGVLEAVLGDSPVLVVHGTVLLPRPTDREIALRPGELVWDRAGLPGIHLRAELGKEVTLGGLTLRDTAFRIYSPTSTAWMETNPFEPVQGYTSTLSIPSAGIEVKLGADVQWNLPEALLYGACDGVTLGKLTQLLDLTGKDGLSSQLPSDLQKAVDAASRLELMRVAVLVGLEGATPVVRSTSCTVGVPDLHWKVFGDHLVVDSLACLFSVTSPQAAATASAAALAASGGGAAVTAVPGAVSVTVFGTLEIEGVPLDISAGSDDGFVLRAQTGKAMKLPVDKLLKSLAPGVQAPSALAIDYLGVTIAPGRSYQLTALLAGAPDPWTIPVGKSSLVVSDVVLSLSCAQGGSATGTFSGRIALNDQVVLEASYDSPGDFLVKSTFRRINLGELVGKLCDAKPGGPADFDLVIESASVQIQKRGDSYVFLTVGSVKGFGLAAVEVRKAGGQWGFAAGVDMSGGLLSQLNGLSALKPIESLVKLDKVMLIASTFDDAGFQFPDQAKLRRSGVTKGFMAFAEWTLRADDKKENLLKQLLGAGATQSCAIAIGANPAQDARLYVESRSTIQGQPFLCKFGVELNGGVPELFLSGTLSVKVLGTMQQFDVLGMFSPGGLMMAASMKGATALDFKAFKLSNVAVQIGVDWAGIPSLGLAGTIDVKKFESSVAVFFDSTDPAKSLVAGSLSPLTLKDVMDTLLGAVGINTPLDEVLKTVSIQGTQTFMVPGALASDLDGLVFDKVAPAFLACGKVTIPSAASSLLLVVSAKGSAWHLTDLAAMKHYELKKKGDLIEVSLMPQFYFAPAPTRLGSTTYPQGYQLHGALDVAGFKASADIDIATAKGVAVDAQMDRIVLGYQDLFCIAAAQGGGGPRVSISTYAQPNQPVKEFQQPHFYVNGQLSMLGVKQSVFASVTTKGLELDVKGMVAPATTLDVHVVAGGSGLNVGGKVKCGVGTVDLGELGKIKVNTDVDGAMGIVVNGRQIQAWVEGGLQFMGQHLDIGRAKLDTSPDAIAKLAETMEKKVEVELRKLFADANQWANAMKGGLVDGVNDTAKVFTNVYKKSAKEASDMANSISGGANSAVKATENAAKDAGHAISSGTKSAGKKVKKWFS